jgi:hypothetical protein
LTRRRAPRIIPGMGTAAGVIALASVFVIVVVLPLVALRRSRLQAPPGRDKRFVQHSENPMPDKNYHGQGSSGV